MINKDDIYETPEILISGEIDKMEITALNIKSMTEMFIAQDNDPTNLVYYIDVKKIFNTAGIEFNRFAYRRFRDIGAKELAEKNKYIGFINENGNFEQMPYFQDIEWMEEEGLVKVTLAQRFKEIYTNPSLKKIKGHLKDTLALETRHGIRMFPKLVLRFRKSQQGTRMMEFKAEGSLKGKSFLDIWPIKKFRREFNMSEKTYPAGMIKNACVSIAEDITTNTEYNCTVSFNYWKDPAIKHSNEALTHICWNLRKKNEGYMQIQDTETMYAAEIADFGYSQKESTILSAALVQNGEDMGLFRTLHSHVSDQDSGIENKIGWLMSGIENHYKFK